MYAIYIGVTEVLGGIERTPAYWVRASMLGPPKDDTFWTPRMIPFPEFWSRQGRMYGAKAPDTPRILALSAKILPPETIWSQIWSKNYVHLNFGLLDPNV